MSIRTEAIELYIGAYNKLRGMCGYELEEIELDSVGNRGIGFDVFRYFLKMLERRESVVKFIKRELHNILNLNTLVLFVESLSEENYEWFKEYVRNEYAERGI